MATVGRILKKCLPAWLVLCLVMQGLLAATPLHAHESDGEGAQAVHCADGKDCRSNCEASHTHHSPTGLAAASWTASRASPCAPLPAPSLLFSIHVPETASRPPLAARV